MIEKNKIKPQIDLAEKLLRQGKYNEAIVLLEAINKVSPEEESVMLMLSWAYYDSGNTKQAVKYLNILLERELKRKVFTGFAFDELVRIYKQEKNFHRLVKICERAVAAQPEDVGLLAELGNAYLQSGRSEKACDIYEKLIGIENDNPAFYCNWGEALFAAGLTKESEKAYLKASEIDPDQLDNYYFKIAVLFQQAGNHKEAQRLLNKCITINSANPLYYCSLGDSLIGLGQIPKALKAYETAMRQDNYGTGAYYNRFGHALMKANNFSQAVEAFKLAISCEPARPYYLSLASAYKKMDLDDQADKILCEINKIK
ncbi:MAG: tetratricopeptide repeat protein [Deltaproteobacteria bacterium]|nr:tetratricopeptide repeat protein [Deltaproteobacteria bacterium]